MLSEFLGYLRLGLTHIADPRGYDHILFVAALTGAYPPRAWRHLLWLVTAFTAGHSITLALATLGVMQVRAPLVELLIPVTIVITSAVTVAAVRERATGLAANDADAGRRRWELYALALVFGLVHGLGFSTFLRAALGGEERITLPLFAFNVGLELGQLLIVAGTMLVGALVVRVAGLARRDWVLLLAGATAGVAGTMILDRLSGV